MVVDQAGPGPLATRQPATTAALAGAILTWGDAGHRRRHPT